jgi:hypothetical protein
MFVKGKSDPLNLTKKTALPAPGTLPGYEVDCASSTLSLSAESHGDSDKHYDAAFMLGYDRCTTNRRGCQYPIRWGCRAIAFRNTTGATHLDNLGNDSKTASEMVLRGVCEAIRQVRCTYDRPNAIALMGVR